MIYLFSQSLTCVSKIISIENDRELVQFPFFHTNKVPEEKIYWILVCRIAIFDASTAQLYISFLANAMFMRVKFISIERFKVNTHI